MAAVEDDVRRVLAAEHGVGLRPRRNQDRPRRQHTPRAVIRLGGGPGQPQRRRLAEIDLDLTGVSNSATDALHRLCTSS